MLVALALVGGCCVVSPVAGAARSSLRVYAFRHRTDHVAVLATCLQLMKTAKLDPKTREAFYDLSRSSSEPGVTAPASDLPRAILALEPNKVWVRRDEVVIECGGGLWHYGFVATANGAYGSPSAEKLIDGLYLYSE